MARITGRGIRSGLFPMARRAAMPAIARWKAINSTGEMTCVAYSGTAANIDRKRSSKSWAAKAAKDPPPCAGGPSLRSGLMDTPARAPHRKDHRVAIGRLGHGLVRRLDQRQRAEDRRARLAPSGVQRDPRKGDHDIERAAQHLVDEGRRLADHLLEVVLGDAARLVGVDHHLHRARGLGLGLLDDPPPEAGRFFPVNVAHRIAAHVFAERMDLRSRTGAVRGMQLAVDGAEALPRGLLVEKPRKDDHLSLDAHATLLQEKAERIARVEVELLQLHGAAA